MYGHDALSFVNINHLLMAEYNHFQADGDEEPNEEDNQEDESLNTVMKKPDCSAHQCPEGESVMTSTDANGSVKCSCFDGGKALKSVGYGLGAIALIGLATTGLIVYGAYRIIRG
jgi:hypothetical protein